MTIQESETYQQLLQRVFLNVLAHKSCTLLALVIVEVHICVPWQTSVGSERNGGLEGIAILEDKLREEVRFRSERWLYRETDIWHRHSLPLGGCPLLLWGPYAPQGLSLIGETSE